ncbi:MAG: DUF423 domain-containing protein [Gillisia sp.]
MQRKLYITGFLFGLIAIVLGAFATHGLKPLISENSAAVFETGVRYHMYHALLLVLLGNVKNFQNKQATWIYYLLIFGVILFSGSIYLLAINSLTSFDFTVIALLTPLGGTLLILAWLLLIFRFSKLKNK